MFVYFMLWCTSANQHERFFQNRREIPHDIPHHKISDVHERLPTTLNKPSHDGNRARAFGVVRNQEGAARYKKRVCHSNLPGQQAQKEFGWPTRKTITRDASIGSLLVLTPLTKSSWYCDHTNIQDSSTDRSIASSYPWAGFHLADST